MPTGPYGVQAPSMPGQAVTGYGPSGGFYNTENPVYQTQGGMRPANAAGVGGNAPATGPYAAPAYQNAPQRPFAWTAAGKNLAAMEQQRYGQDFYNNPAATGGQQPGAPGAGGGAGGANDPFSIATGINATLPPGAMNASVNSMMRSAGVPIAGSSIPNIAQHYGNLAQGLLSSDATDVSRLASFGMTDWLRDAEQARANAGIGWGNVALQNQALGIDEILGLGDLYGNSLNLMSNVLRN